MRELTREERYINNRNIGIIELRGSKLVYKAHSCNLGGDPAKGYRGSTQRFCNLSVDEETAEHLRRYGVDVRETRPYGDETEGFEPDYFVKVIANFKDDPNDIRNPKFYLVKNGSRVEIGRDDLKSDIDEGRIMRVKASLNPFTREDGGVTLYIRYFYAEMFVDEDPFAADYMEPHEEAMYPQEDEMDMPFL